MGLFSRKPPPELPQRDDLQGALDGLDPKDADRIRSKRHLAEACAQLPETRVLAVLDGVITEPHTTDDGLLCVSEEVVTYQGSHSGSMTFPIAAIKQAE